MLSSAHVAGVPVDGPAAAAVAQRRLPGLAHPAAQPLHGPRPPPQPRLPPLRRLRRKVRHLDP